ncbi:Scaffold-type E3 ligase [Cryptotrichosporon argae]
MSKPTKSAEKALLKSFQEYTGASSTDAARYLKKYRTLERAVDGYYNEGGGAATPSSTSNDSARDKKLGDIWETYKDPSNPKLITIEGTMEYCQALDIDPESDSVLFCLAADLGSKTTGEWEKGPFVEGWKAMPGNIDSLEKMKAHLPTLRKRLNTDPVYFKKVYMHVFDLIKAPGARVVTLDTAIDMWNLFLPPALAAKPSALSHVSPDTPTAPSTEPPTFSQKSLDMWLDFQRERGKAVSKDTWSLLIDFMRTIDADLKAYDEEAAWPSTIDDFVEYVRERQKT